MPTSGDVSDTETPGISRKRQRYANEPQARPARRALSCTECKRRKTKCSALGQTPCDACIKRKRPQDCVWEDLHSREGEPTRHISDLDLDVKLLRKELEDLREAVITLRNQQLPLSRRPSEYTPSSGIETSHTHHRPALEATLDTLEQSAVGPLAGTNPTEPTNTMFGPAQPKRSLTASVSPSDKAPHKGFAHSLLLDTSAGSWLIHAFFTGPMYRGWYSVEEVSFRAEYEEYRCSSTEQQSQTDNIWLALAYMILAMGVKFGNQGEIRGLLPLYSPEDIKHLPEDLYEASVTACRDSDCLIVPQIRHIQVCLLYVVYLFHFGRSTRNANMALRHLDTAITTAQWLGLDRLSHSQQILPIDDPALALFSTSTTQEVCKRLLHMLSFLDGSIARSPGTSRLGHSSIDLNSSLPRNYLDIDLQRSDMPAERDPTVFTRSTLPRVGSLMASAIRLHMPTAGDLSFSQAMEFDQALRAVLAELPPRAVSPSAEDALRHRWMTHHLYSSIHNRLLRIHRPYMVTGYLQDTFHSSRLTSIESANSIIQTQLLFVGYPQLRPRFVKRWILGAAIILALDHFLITNMHYDTGNQVLPARSESRDAVAQALQIFELEDQTSETASVSRQCAKTLNVLLSASDARRPFGSSDLEIQVQSFLDDVKARLSVSSDTPSVRNDSITPEQGLGGLAPDLVSFDMLFPMDPDDAAGRSKEGDELRELWNQWIAG